MGGYSKGMRKKLERAKTCYYCSRWLTWDNEKDYSHKNVDHFIPRYHGGRGVQMNLVICCRACNDLKANLLPHEFIGKIQSMLQFKSFQVFNKSQLHHMIYQVEQFQKSNSYQLIWQRILLNKEDQP